MLFRSQTALPITVTFDTTTTPTTYTLQTTAIPPVTVGAGNYTSGQAIQGTTPAVPPSVTPVVEWTLILQGAPQNGDTFTVRDIKDPSIGLDPRLNGGNATNLMNLRDAAVFDGAAMTDGYASLIAQIGTRSQSANYSAQVSTNIATNAEKDRTGIAGVNLDEEAAKLIQYQQAYQASAKMIQIAQSIFDTLIQTLAR